VQQGLEVEQIGEAIAFASMAYAHELGDRKKRSAFVGTARRGEDGRLRR
jgi:hypothetical protein